MAEAKAFVDMLNDGELSAKERGQDVRSPPQEIERLIDKRQRKAWDEQNRSWQDELSKDSEIGSDRLRANLSKAKRMEAYDPTAC